MADVEDIPDAAAAASAAASAAATLDAGTGVPIPESPVGTPAVLGPELPPGISANASGDAVSEVEQLRQQVRELTAQMAEMVKMQMQAQKKNQEEEEAAPNAKRTKAHDGRPRSASPSVQDPWMRWDSAGRGTKREAAEAEERSEPAENRGLGTARFGRVIRTARRTQSPAAARNDEESTQQDEKYEHEDYLRLVDPKYFSVKTLEATEKNISYREWARSIKRFVRTRPGCGLGAYKALDWAEAQGKEAISQEHLAKFPDARIKIWESDVLAVILRFCEGFLNKLASNASNGFEAWRKLKNHFEPRLAIRASMYMSEFTGMAPVSSDKDVPEALEKLETVARHYEECRGRPLDPELRMSKILGVLPRELRSKVRSKITDEEDHDEAVLIIMEELQDFATGRIAVQEGGKASLNQVEPKPPGLSQWPTQSWPDPWQSQQSGDAPGSGEGGQESAGDEHQRSVDNLYQKGKGKGKGYTGSCFYCQQPGHRANECLKKTADLKAKGLGREAPGYKGKGYGGGKGGYPKGGYDQSYSSGQWWAKGSTKGKGKGNPPWQGKGGNPWQGKGGWQGKGMNSLAMPEYQGWQQGWPMPALGSIQPAQDPSGEFVQSQSPPGNEGYQTNSWGDDYAWGTALWSLEKKPPGNAKAAIQMEECGVCGGDVEDFFEQDIREYWEIQGEFDEVTLKKKLEEESVADRKIFSSNRFAALASDDEEDEEDQAGSEFDETKNSQVRRTSEKKPRDTRRRVKHCRNLEEEEEELLSPALAEAAPRAESPASAEAAPKAELQPPALRKRRWGNRLAKTARKMDVLGRATNKGLCNLETSRYELVEITVDSGAEESVTPVQLMAQFPTQETEESKSGEQFVAANGSVINNEGERHVEMHTLDGVKRSMVFQVTTVNKALASVARMNEKGNVVVFDGDNSYIQNKVSGEVIPMKKKQGSWVLEVWVEKDPSKAAGFAGQGQ